MSLRRLSTLQVLSVLLVVHLATVASGQRNIVFPFLHWGSTIVGDTVVTSGLEPQQAITAANLAVDYFNSHFEPLIPDDVTIQIDAKDHGLVISKAITIMADWYLEGYTIVLGNIASDILAQTGLFGTVYGAAQISSAAAGISLANKHQYPWITRLASSASRQAEAILASIGYFSQASPGGHIGWDRVAIIGTTDAYSVELCREVIRLSELANSTVEVATYQQVLQLSGVVSFDVSVEVQQLKNSGCRIFLGLGFYGWGDVLLEGVKQKIVGDNFVWMTGGSTVTQEFYLDLTTNLPDPNMVEASRGAFAFNQYSPRIGANYDLLLDLWHKADPEVHIGAGPDTLPGDFAMLTFDMMLVTAQVVTQLDKEGLLDNYLAVDCAKWSQLYRNTSLPEGASGPLVFTEEGERITPMALLNWRPESLSWVPTAVEDYDHSITILDDFIWHDNTSNIPDLDIRPPFDYWSCKHKEKRTDPTGKTIKLRKPDADDVNYIEKDYHCDEYIDCQNMSDETVDCSTNYIIVYVIFGVLAGIMIIICFLLIIFVVVLGWIVTRKRVQAASPLFLLIIVIASILGLSSIYAWFGKPHPVACAFQPWLLGLGVSALITALFSRCLRIWRIFNFPMNHTHISNVELIVFWAVTMTPSVIILVLWFIVSTPTAVMTAHGDRDHYFCDSGGFTGPPGGYIFFAIFVGYNSIIALGSAVLTIATRKVPVLFNETRMLAFTIYNLIFLTIVIIPTVIVLQELEYPFVAWIMRTVAILYAFTTTLALQFIPKIVGLVFIDRCKDLTVRQVRQSVAVNIGFS